MSISGEAVLEPFDDPSERGVFVTRTSGYLE